MGRTSIRWDCCLESLRSFVAKLLLISVWCLPSAAQTTDAFLKDTANAKGFFVPERWEYSAPLFSPE